MSPRTRKGDPTKNKAAFCPGKIVEKPVQYVRNLLWIFLEKAYIEELCLPNAHKLCLPHIWWAKGGEIVKTPKSGGGIF